MSTRRPRIKAVANIQSNVKRKQKAVHEIKDAPENKCSAEKNIDEDEDKYQSEAKKEHQSTAEGIVEHEDQVHGTTESISNNNLTSKEPKGLTVSNNNHDIEFYNTESNNNSLEVKPFIVENNSKNEFAKPDDATNRRQCNIEGMNEAAFKYPPKIDNNRPMVSGADDVFYSDLEENALQMDINKSNNWYPLSPTKSPGRQRVRIAPVVSQRRNSFISACQNSLHDDSTNSMECLFQPNRRERLPSSSSVASASNQNRPFVNATLRKRTESGCSTVSEAPQPNIHTARKSEGQNYRRLAKKDFLSRFTHGVPDKSEMKMSDYIFYNPATNPIQENNDKLPMKSEINNVTNMNPIENVGQELQSENHSSETKENVNESKSSSSMPVPQLKLNANGELILDDKSLVIETTAEKTARQTLANTEIIYLDERSGTNGFYKRKKRCRDWSAKETIRFYRCLQTVGTDFSLMESLFPDRIRRDLKLKFKREERVNAILINKAVLNPKEFNIDELKQQFVNDEEVRQKKLKKQQMHNQRKRTKKKQCVGSSAAERVLTSDHPKKPPKLRRTHKRKQLNTNTEKCEANIGDETSKKNFKIEVNDNDINQMREMTLENKNEMIKYEENPFNHQESMIEEKMKEEEDGDIELELNHILQMDENDLPNNTLDDHNYINNHHYNNNPCANNNNDDILKHETSSNQSMPSLCGSLYNVLTGVNECIIEEEYVDDSDFTKHTIINLNDDGIMAINESNHANAFIEDNNQHLIGVDSKEERIQQILYELSNRSLVLISTSDLNNQGQVIHEIYKVDERTDELDGEPLDVPQNILQNILSLLSDI